MNLAWNVNIIPPWRDIKYKAFNSYYRTRRWNNSRRRTNFTKQNNLRNNSASYLRVLIDNKGCDLDAASTKSWWIWVPTYLWQYYRLVKLTTASHTVPFTLASWASIPIWRQVDVRLTVVWQILALNELYRQSIIIYYTHTHTHTPHTDPVMMRF